MITTCFARGAVLGGILIALVAGTPSRAGAADALVAVGDELAVGKNRTGETCRLRLVESRTDFGGYTRYSLLCEGWTQPSGEIRRFGIRKDFKVDKLLTDSLWEKSFATRLGDCGAVEPTTVSSGLPAALRECRRLDGDFRAVVVGVVAGPRVYGLETFPTNLPVLEAAVEVLEGKRAPADAGKASGSLSAAIRRAEAMVDATGKLTGIRDLGALCLWARKPSGCATSAGKWKRPRATPRDSRTRSCRWAGPSSISSGWTRQSAISRGASPSSTSPGRTSNSASGTRARCSCGWAWFTRSRSGMPMPASSSSWPWPGGACSSATRSR